MNQELKLTGNHIYIREWKITDAKMLATLGEQSKIENAELRIIDWSMRFTQTKLGTLPIFNKTHELLGIVTLQPKIQKNKAIFLLSVTPEEQIPLHFVDEVKNLMQSYAKEVLGILEIQI